MSCANGLQKSFCCLLLNWRRWLMGTTGWTCRAFLFNSQRRYISVKGVFSYLTENFKSSGGLIYQKPHILISELVGAVVVDFEEDPDADWEFWSNDWMAVRYDMSRLLEVLFKKNFLISKHWVHIPSPSTRRTPLASNFRFFSRCWTRTIRWKEVPAFRVSE